MPRKKNGTKAEKRERSGKRGNKPNKRGSQKYPQQIDMEARKVRIREIDPKNWSQQSYIDNLRDGTVNICSGPAGTGKTFLATYVALKQLLDGDVNKIVITRPIVEAGEKLGFLPGDLNDKVHPYLLPLLDAIEYFVGPKMLKELQENGQIEIAPLAYMRGRGFTESFVILDEAQNATRDQIKMFLSRIGEDSKFVINGDTAQSDVSRREENGLSWVTRKLSGVHPEIIVSEFNKSDIVRSQLISTILTNLEAPDPKSEQLNG